MADSEDTAIERMDRPGHGATLVLIVVQLSPAFVLLNSAASKAANTVGAAGGPTATAVALAATAAVPGRFSTQLVSKVVLLYRDVPAAANTRPDCAPSNATDRASPESPAPYGNQEEPPSTDRNSPFSALASTADTGGRGIRHASISNEFAGSLARQVTFAARGPLPVATVEPGGSARFTASIATTVRGSERRSDVKPILTLAAPRPSRIAATSTRSGAVRRQIPSMPPGTRSKGMTGISLIAGLASLPGYLGSSGLVIGLAGSCW